ncbi:hypothetical protein AC578_9975 [Pseudocercospora eumusae]|uniref:RNA helicase n=1 Tax=Pseudocercospora eumusae TaxID=321146 RepID=A0A139HML4_9PEZI|nr:hypothetical protein AC578_9975 [Pseudocercospora eumusae]
MARSPARRRDDRDRDTRRDRDREYDRNYRRRSRSRDRRDDRTRDRSRDYPRDHRDRGYERDRSREHGRNRRGPRSRSRGPQNGRSPVRDPKNKPRHPREDDHVHDNGHRIKRQRTTSVERGEPSSRPSTSSGPLNGDSRKPPPTAEDEAKQKAKAERQAKVELWKAKKAAEKAKLEAGKAASASALTPTVASPSNSQPTTAVGSPAPAPTFEDTPATTRAKFDPKAIKKQTEGKSKSEQATLGGDAAVPATANGNANAQNAVPQTVNVPKGDCNVKATNSNVAKMTGFGLNKSAVEKAGDKAAAAKSAALDDEDDVQRKFRKLPDLALESTTSDVVAANGEDDQDDDVEDLRSDEEEAEAARQAAQKRAEEAQEEQDATMPDAETSAPATTSAAVADTAMELDEEVDPLDAFMDKLEEVPERRPQPSAAKRGAREPQLFDEDDGPDLDAVGDNPEDLLNPARRKKKEIPAVNHSKIDYEEFRKNFYNESIEVSEMTEDDVTTLRAELDNITVRGVDPPKPIMKWSQAGFGAQVLDVIRENKFQSPTSIQCQALPAIMSGRDTIGIAKTGSGKTLAFILPMFRHIKDQRPVANLEGPIGIIMAPTRELAVQIHRECKPYLKALGLRGVCAYGGAPIKDQIAELKRGAEVVVCTPGRMIDLLAANQGRVTNLRRVTYVVMDEADRMFDMGFEPQITRILGNVRPDRQTVLFSATFPKKMESLARKTLSKPVEIVVGGRSVVAPEITQIIEVRPEDTKFRRVLELLGNLHEEDEDARSLIFVERQETADHIFKELGKKGYPSVSVHGGREQIDRDQAILDFKSGAIPIMVATSVAARGLDVKQLKLVINFDSPNHGEDYVHRAGRTGRAGNTGTAVTFVTPEQDRYAPFLVRCLEDSKQEPPDGLKELAAAHKKKVEAGEASRAGSGFGGHGIERLDAARAAERAREKSMFKTGDEPEEENEEAKKEKDKKESDVEKLVSKAAGKVTDRDAQAEQTRQADIRTDLKTHLANALKVSKTETPAANAATISDPVQKALAAAASIGVRLGTKGSTRPGAPIDNRGPDAGAFHATLEINDFPQKARWAVTNRTNVAKILEATGTSITSKGVHYPPGKEINPGDEPKLYILVEGDTEIAVQSAMRELSRHLTEGTLQAQDAENRSGGGGRYRVV